MKHYFILMICALSAGCLIAQTDGNRIVTSNPYFFDEFKEGSVFFTEGNPVRVKLNYNFVLQEIEFLDHQNNDQVLTLVRKPNMTHIEVRIGTEKTVFVPLQKAGWAAVVQDGPITLLEEKRYTPEVSRKGAYGTSLATAGSGAYSLTSMGTVLESTGHSGETVISSNPNTGGITVTTIGGGSDAGGISGGAVGAHMVHLRPPVEYKVETRYWLMKDKRIYSPSRKGFLRLYPAIRPNLETFLSEHPVDFRNGDHLGGLTRFANGLLITQ